MNRRQWKKACKKAAIRLEREFPGQYVIEPARGDETVYAPRGYEPPHGERQRGRRFTAPPRGTPIVWEWPGYCESMWDCKTALEVYERCLGVKRTDRDAMLAHEEEELASAAGH